MSKRVTQILKLFEEQDFLSVQKLSELLGVSPMTIRRDLDEMENRKLVRRLHGGVIAIKTQNNEPKYLERASIQVEEKKRIAKEASKLIVDNSVIAIDSGSTCLELVKLLKDRKLTVVTTSFRVMEGLLYSDGVKVVVPCGTLRPHEGAIMGPETVDYLSKLHIDQFFMGIGGVDSNADITDYSLEDVAVKKMLISNSSKVIMLADSSKFNRVTFVRICSASDIDILITEENPVGKLNEYLQRSGVSIITPEVEEE